MSSRHSERSAPGATLQSITELSHDKQVELLSDALLREYMHRRGFRGTLKAFDQEHPRDEQTISSRALMSELMALQSSDQQRFKKDNIETIMEMLCALRIERRQRVAELQAQANVPLPIISEEEQKLLERDETMNELQENNVSGKVTKTKQPRAKESRVKSAHVSNQNESIEDSEVSDYEEETEYEEEEEELSSSLESQSSVDEDEDEGGMTIDELLGDNNEHKEEKAHRANTKSTLRKNIKKKHIDQKEKRNNNNKKNKMQVEDELMPTPPKSNLESTNARHATQLAKKTSNKKKSAKHSNKTRENDHTYKRLNNDSNDNDDDDATSDVESELSETTTTINDEDDDDEDEEVSSEGSNDSECREDGGDEVSHEELQKVFLALFGTKASNKANMVYHLCEQGFVYDNIIEYALVELEQEQDHEHNNNETTRREDVQSNSYLSLILSTVQAFIIAYYFERSAYTETTIRQRDCLCRAVLTILTTAQPDVRKVVLVNGKLPQRHSAKYNKLFSSTSRMQHYVANKFYEWREFVSVSELEQQLSILVEKYWMQSDGCGVWCFLLSLALSRGGTSIMHDFKQSFSSNSRSPSPSCFAHSSHKTTRERSSSSFMLPRALLENSPSSTGHRALINLILYGKACPFNVQSTPNTRSNTSSSQNFYRHSLTCGLLIGWKVKEHLELDSDNNGSSSSNSKISLSNNDMTHATHPVYPSWVIYHNNRCANLFMKADARKSLSQRRTIGGKVSFDMYYWDVATMDDEIKLTLTLAPSSTQSAHHQPNKHTSQSMSNIASAYATSFVNRAIATVPEWNGAEVNWHGVLPLR